MDGTKGTSGNGRIEALLKRAGELKARLVTEKKELRRRDEQDRERAFQIVGAAILADIKREKQTGGMSWQFSNGRLRASGI